MAIKQSEVWDEIFIKAVRMKPEQINDSIEQLAMDSRFPALIALIFNNREAFVATSSGQSEATHHGVIAHAGGSVHACAMLMGQLRGIVAGNTGIKGGAYKKS